MYCQICPRACHAERNAETGAGICQMLALPKVARAALHHWEEPCISGKKGSGTIFFSGCNLHCVFCQNYEISWQNQGKVISVAQLKKLFQNLIEQGAHNINLVNPTHYSHLLAEVLAQSWPVPIVWNSSGYESVETLRSLAGKVQIYLPDLKYADAALAQRYAKVPDYFTVATEAILEMQRQVGDYQLDEQGMLQKGVLIRHLLLPGAVENTKQVIQWVQQQFKPGQVLFSLLAQYLPWGELQDYPELNRKLYASEYEEAMVALFDAGIEDGFVQELSAADDGYIPDFRLVGIEE